MSERSINSLDPLPIKVEDSILIGSIHNNTFDWQIDKTIEECLRMATTLTEYRKNKPNAAKQLNDAYLCPFVADLTIQVAILCKILSVPLIQEAIDARLKSIDSKNRRLNTPKSNYKAGFSNE